MATKTASVVLRDMYDVYQEGQDRGCQIYLSQIVKIKNTGKKPFAGGMATWNGVEYGIDPEDELTAPLAFPYNILGDPFTFGRDREREWDRLVRRCGHYDIRPDQRDLRYIAQTSGLAEEYRTDIDEIFTPFADLPSLLVTDLGGNPLDGGGGWILYNKSWEGHGLSERLTDVEALAASVKAKDETIDQLSRQLGDMSKQFESLNAAVEALTEANAKED